ncbi:polysaccharide deacetylase family protein [Anaerosalibacter sp. Marseille-P3206]|uniref:polysaccharide deacetylase family protein n=1 Tax=Anaerosalibacter sp. Marseille-P3206 TaxID=1871005 RepID=UPI0013566267|nr:polysaccharide deacetylase family protein [Anaerosalibacter sp. Marseille-P3206]
MEKTRTKRRKIRRRRRLVFTLSIFLLFVIIGTGVFILDKLSSKGVIAGNVGIIERKHQNDDNISEPFKEIELDGNKNEIHKALIEKEIKVAKETEKPKVAETIENNKIAYLTFDDGPSTTVTPKILDILDEYDIKATFYVIGYLAERNPELIIREYESGHSIGNHTYSHNYKYVYKNVKSFLAELDKNEKALKNILGNDFHTSTVRFPGGSFGDKRKPYRNALKDKDITYVDWNALNGDAEGHNIPKAKLVKRLKETSKGKDKLIILMHDAGAKKTTVEALPEIIEYLISQGYEFKVIE